MKRREFIALLGGAAAAWPLTAHAQKAMPVIGFLSVSQPPGPLIDAFRKGLSEMGLVEGRNVAFEHHAADNDYDRFRAMADDLVRRDVAVIFSIGGSAGARAAKAATVTIPIVFYIGSDPVQLGLVASLGRRGGNLTGISMLGGELGQAAGAASRAGAECRRLRVAGKSKQSLPRIPDASRATGRSHPRAAVARLQCWQRSSIGRRLAKIKQRAGALIVSSDAFFSGQRSLITALAARHGLPAIYDRREFPDTGGLISYGHDRADAYRQLGIYAGRIIKGEKPSDLPVLQPTKFELVINMRTAKALGLNVPLHLADEVIE